MAPRTRPALLVGVFILAVAACGDDDPQRPADGSVNPDAGSVDLAGKTDGPAGVDAPGTDGPGTDGPSTDGPSADGPVTKKDTAVTKKDTGTTKKDTGVTKPDSSVKLDSGVKPDSKPPPPPPPTTCTAPIKLVDTSKPTATVGKGTAASCTEAALTAALAQGGIITFSCGAAARTITVTTAKAITKDTVLDGGGKITLSGGNKSRILHVKSYFTNTKPKLTVQRMAFINGYTTDVVNTKSTAKSGAAIYREGGALDVIDCSFTGNHGPKTGQDVAGGAVFSVGVGQTTIVGSTFTANTCSNGGAIGNLGNALTVVNSKVLNNSATGNSGNPGNGGNGGGIVIDGKGKTITICGTTISGNKGNAYGGGVFRVSYQKEPTNIDRCTVDGNSIPDVSPSKAGGLYLQGTTINLTNSTISNNTARSDGGIFVGPSSVAKFTNVTITGNKAASSLGGGVTFSSNVTGKLLNCTIVYNSAPGSVAFGGGTAGGTTAVVLQNTIVANNKAGNAWNPINCTKKLGNGGSNFQWPIKRASGQTDNPCTDKITFKDPLLDVLKLNGGPTKTIAPKAGSPVIGAGTSGCPKTDQRGKARKTPCTAGAYEYP